MMMKYRLLITFLTGLLLTDSAGGAENSSVSTTTTTTVPTPSPRRSSARTSTARQQTTQTLPTTTLTPKQECAKHNSSCESCLKVAKCMFCKVGVQHCKPYPSSHILPRSSDCPLADARWGVCFINFKALIISMSVIGAALLIFFCCCIYCCCCRKGNKTKYLKDELKYEREKSERKQKADERRVERKVRNDEIRKKYGIKFAGLMKDDNPYQRFDA